MNDYYLRADTEAEMRAALPDFVFTPGAWGALDLIGPIELTPAVWDGLVQVTPAVMDTRYHANLRTAEPVDLDPAIVIYPVNPRRRWL